MRSSWSGSPGRRTDPATGHAYHLTFDPPPIEIMHRLVHRADDTEAVLRRRLEEYSEKTAPIVPYYEARGLLRRVNGEGAVADVKRRVMDALGDPGGRHRLRARGGAPPARRVSRRTYSSERMYFHRFEAPRPRDGCLTVVRRLLARDAVARQPAHGRCARSSSV